jgi:hypothetical protein
MSVGHGADGPDERPALRFEPDPPVVGGNADAARGREKAVAHRVAVLGDWRGFFAVSGAPDRRHLRGQTGQGMAKAVLAVVLQPQDAVVGGR